MRPVTEQEYIAAAGQAKSIWKPVLVPTKVYRQLYNVYEGENLVGLVMYLFSGETVYFLDDVVWAMGLGTQPEKGVRS